MPALKVGRRFDLKLIPIRGKKVVGILQNFRRDPVAAETICSRALAADPNDSINLTNYGGLCLAMGQGSRNPACQVVRVTAPVGRTVGVARFKE